MAFPRGRLHNVSSSGLWFLYTKKHSPHRAFTATHATISAYATKAHCNTLRQSHIKNWPIFSILPSLIDSGAVIFARETFAKVVPRKRAKSPLIVIELKICQACWYAIHLLYHASAKSPIRSQIRVSFCILMMILKHAEHLIDAVDIWRCLSLPIYAFSQLHGDLLALSCLHI